MSRPMMALRRGIFALAPWLVLVFILRVVPGVDGSRNQAALSFFGGFLGGMGLAGLWMGGIEAIKPGWEGWLRAITMGICVSAAVRLLNEVVTTGGMDRSPRTWGGFATFSVVSLILGFVIHLLAFHRAEALRQQALAEEARRLSLRAKLAPHFIFNTLNTLKAQISRDPRGAEAMTDRLAALFRQIVERAEAPAIPLREELGFVEAYLGIEQARLGGRLRLAIEVPEELEADALPPLSLQVLVENAVKHGIAPLEQGGELRIGAWREGADLVLEVSDPGNGIGAQRGTGTALETLRSRLARPEDLSLARVDGRTVASFRWRQA